MTDLAGQARGLPLEERQAAFAAFVLTAHADRELGAAEQAAIAQARFALEVDGPFATRCLADAKSRTLRVWVPQSPPARALLFEAVVAAAVADGTASPEEKAILRRIGRIAGVPEAEIDQTITLLGLPPEERTTSARALASLVGRIEAPPSTAAEKRSVLLRALVPVLSTYGVGAIGIALFPPDRIPGFGTPDSWVIPLVMVGVSAVFTTTHGLLAAVAYVTAIKRLTDARGLQGCFSRAFIIGHAGFWFGMPMAALTAMTGGGGAGIAVAAVHVALSPRGRRFVTFIQYGSTSLALLFFFVGTLAAPGALKILYAVPAMALQTLILMSLERIIRRVLPEDVAVA